MFLSLTYRDSGCYYRAGMASPKGPFYEQLGRQIAAFRRERRLSQSRLAAAVQLTRTSITNIEKGRQIVAAHTLVQLAQTLGTSVTDLIPKDDLSEPTRKVERELSALQPAQKAWALKVLKAAVSEEYTLDATKIRPGPEEGRRTDRKSTGRKPSRSR
jgi:transcriptional regulator with XRE-family HTH domain